MRVITHTNELTGYIHLTGMHRQVLKSLSIVILEKQQWTKKTLSIR